MPDLLDVSVWLPLSAEGHVHHRRAVEYWSSEAATEIAFCRVTSLALVRHLTNPLIMGPDVQTSAAAWDIYLRWLGLPGVTVVSEPEGLEDCLGLWSQTMSIGSRGWTDAYLAAFAAAGGHRIVAFDGAYHRFTGVEFLHLTI